MISWVYAILVVAFIGVVGYLIWDWAAGLYAVKLPETCTGCQKHYVRSDCPVHNNRRIA